MKKMLSFGFHYDTPLLTWHASLIRLSFPDSVEGLLRVAFVRHFTIIELVFMVECRIPRKLSNAQGPEV